MTKIVWNQDIVDGQTIGEVFDRFVALMSLQVTPETQRIILNSDGLTLVQGAATKQHEIRPDASFDVDGLRHLGTIFGKVPMYSDANATSAASLVSSLYKEKQDVIKIELAQALKFS